jgi:hypothetical protein
MRKQNGLPVRICLSCGKPFTWRKKWKTVWNEVRYCSERCRRSKQAAAAQPERDRTPGRP